MICLFDNNMTLKFYNRSKKDDKLDFIIPKMKMEQVSHLYDHFLSEDEMDEMKTIINYVSEIQLKELIDICKVKNQLNILISLLEIEKMSGFFLECQKIGDRSSIQLILAEIGVSTIDFGLDILLYAIENFDEFIQKIFDNLFKDAALPGGPTVIFGEIRGDGMVIDGSSEVSDEIIDGIVDRESEEVQNSIVVKTMRCQVSDVLGSQITIDVLE